MTFCLSSPAFADGEMIPSKYTCDGSDFSPPFAWTDAPAGTACYALIVDDPDVPGMPYVHWLLYNLPGYRTSLLENFNKNPELPDGTLQGINGFGRSCYGGPCPPSGAHRYYFRLYALKQILTLPPKADRAKLEYKMKPYVLGAAILMGTYERQKKQEGKPR